MIKENIDRFYLIKVENFHLAIDHWAEPKMKEWEKNSWKTYGRQRVILQGLCDVGAQEENGMKPERSSWALWGGECWSRALECHTRVCKVSTAYSPDWGSSGVAAARGRAWRPGTELPGGSSPRGRFLLPLRTEPEVSITVPTPGWCGLRTRGWCLERRSGISHTSTTVPVQENPSYGWGHRGTEPFSFLSLRKARWELPSDSRLRQ